MNTVITGINDLATVHPELLSEWDYEKNSALGLYPDKVSYASHRKVWWKCSEGHSWEAGLSDRSRGNKCPYCSGKKVLVGYNDFMSRFPDAARYWHPTKNGDLQPDMFTWCSGKWVWWLCPICGHEWQAPISHRTSRKHGCPKCNSVHSTSFSEQATFYYVKQYFDDALNRHNLTDVNGSFEVDIYLPLKQIAVEYDGIYYHKNKSEKDKAKEVRLHHLKVTLYRILEARENKIEGNFIYYDFYHNYYENLNWAIASLLQLLSVDSNTDTTFSSIDVEADEVKISQIFYTAEIENSLASCFPELLSEWNYERNGSLLPTMVKPFSDRKVWWKCKKCGHEWLSTVGNRSIGQGCLACARQKQSDQMSIPEEGCSLVDKYPEIAKEWNYERNGSLLPSQVSFGSNKKVWWKCSKGHEWQAVISSRTTRNGNGCKCPYCANQKVLVGYNDLASTFPEIAKEWNYEKNGDLLPTQVVFGSNRKVWWKCSHCGNEWIATISSRTSKHKRGCRKCGNVQMWITRRNKIS